MRHKRLVRWLLKLLGIVDDVADVVELGSKTIKAIDDTEPIPLSPRQLRPPPLRNGEKKRR